MKKILFLVITVFSLSVSAQEINWMTLEEAVTAQQTSPKKIFIDAFTTWCGPCKMLDKNTFHNKSVVDYVNENYYAVKFNAEGNETINFKGNTFTNPNFDSSRTGRNSSHQLASYFSISAYPTMLFLDEDGNFLMPLKGYKTPTQLELYLKLFGTDAYKKLTEKGDWENYQSNFKYEFVEKID